MSQNPYKLYNINPIPLNIQNDINKIYCEIIVSQFNNMKCSLPEISSNYGLYCNMGW